MRIAFTIGAYRLADFVRLGIQQIKSTSNGTCTGILISDDRSEESPHIQRLTENEGCHYKGARARRGHFSADFQSLINAVSFAEAAKADIAVKISQRFILRKPEAITVICKAFSDPAVMMATPGKPTTLYGSKHSKGFGAFSTLSDIVMLRVGSISPVELLQMYRQRIIQESSVPWASFIECTVDQLHSSRFAGRTVKLTEFTNPTKDPIYLRRYQCSERQYRELALEKGWNGHFPVAEWNAIEGRNYLCRPMIV